jgi:hypothetical protein
MTCYDPDHREFPRPDLKGAFMETMPGPMEWGLIFVLIIPMAIVGALITVIPFLEDLRQRQTASDRTP